jgi:uncharacterized protein (UPF0332 family)
MKLENDMGEKIFSSLLDVYISPEIERRQEIGTLSNTFSLERAQIIFYPDEHPPVVLLNEELKGIEAIIKIKEGVNKKPGEPIFENEIEGIQKSTLKEPYTNCAHVTIIKLNNLWNIIFNFTYNKDKAKKHIEIAKQFWTLAKVAYKNELWNAFYDNLFSAVELSMKAFFLLFPDKAFYKDTHNGLSTSVNRFANLGNIQISHKSTFNKLSGRRNQARYLQGGDLKIDVDEARNYLKTVDEMIEDCSLRVNS